METIKGWDLSTDFVPMYANNPQNWHHSYGPFKVFIVEHHNGVFLSTIRYKEKLWLQPKGLSMIDTLQAIESFFNQVKEKDCEVFLSLLDMPYDNTSFASWTP